MGPPLLAGMVLPHTWCSQCCWSLLSGHPLLFFHPLTLMMKMPRHKQRMCVWGVCGGGEKGGGCVGGGGFGWGMGWVGYTVGGGGVMFIGLCGTPPHTLHLLTTHAPSTQYCCWSTTAHWLLLPQRTLWAVPLLLCQLHIHHCHIHLPEETGRCVVVFFVLCVVNGVVVHTLCCIWCCTCGVVHVVYVGRL